MFRFALGIAILGIAHLAAADFSGKWAGILEANDKHTGVSLTLFQHGQALAGWAEIGDDARKTPVEKPEIREDELIFEARDNANRLVRFRLKSDTLGLRGEASVEGQVATLSLSRTREGGGPGAGVQTWQYQRSGVSSSPVVLDNVEPESTEEARAAGLQGTVLLRVEVDSTGRLAKTDIQVLRGLGMGLDEKAIEAVKNWKFKPGMRDGHPVATPVKIEVNFRL